jgi:hypothetical protein
VIVEKLKNIINDIKMLNKSHGKTTGGAKLFLDAGIPVEIRRGSPDNHKAVFQPPHKAGLLKPRGQEQGEAGLVSEGQAR